MSMYMSAAACLRMWYMLVFAKDSSLGTRSKWFPHGLLVSGCGFLVDHEIDTRVFERKDIFDEYFVQINQYLWLFYKRRYSRLWVPHCAWCSAAACVCWRRGEGGLPRKLQICYENVVHCLEISYVSPS